MSKRDNQEKAAALILQFCRELDPAWRERIDARLAEKPGETPLQTIGAFIGIVLEAGSQILSPRHPFFDPGFEPAGVERECPRCHVIFPVLFAGQQWCGDECYERRDEPLTAPPRTPAEPDAASLTD